MTSKKVTTEKGEKIYVETYTEEERRGVEVKFIDGVIDTLGVIREALEKGGSNCWILDGGLGDYLQKQGEMYDTLLKSMTISEK